MKQGKDKAGTMHCFNCEHEWQVKDRFVYQQCPKCRAYKVYPVGSIAYHYAVKEKEQSNDFHELKE